MEEWQKLDLYLKTLKDASDAPKINKGNIWRLSWTFVVCALCPEEHEYKASVEYCMWANTSNRLLNS